MASEPAVNTQRIVPRLIMACKSSSLSVFKPLNTTNCVARQRRIGSSNSCATYLPSATWSMPAGTIVLELSRLPAERASFT